MVISNQNLDPKTIDSHLGTIYIGLKQIFQELKLANVNDFDVDIHLSDYLRREILPSHSDSKRSQFFTRYKNVAKSAEVAFDQVDKEATRSLGPFLFPLNILRWSRF